MTPIIGPEADRSSYTSSPKLRQYIMRKYSISPFEICKSLYLNRELILLAARRDIIGRYKGSALGLIWTFVNPLLMLTIYTIVFSTIFKPQWGPESSSKYEYALSIFAGMIVFSIFSECINKAPFAITSNPNFVKKIVYPLEILPIISLAAALYHAFISLIIWIIAYTLFIGTPNITAIYIPIIILPLCLFIIGLSWLLASIGVFLRDTPQFTTILTTILMFLSPVFFTAASIPDGYKLFLNINPLAAPIELLRGALMNGTAPHPFSFILQTAVSAITAWIGFAWFQKTRNGFADVL